MPDFSFSITDLITLDAPISAPHGIVYSTNPHVAEAANDKTYVVKGPEVETVFGELGGCILAASVGIPVPPVALCRAEDQYLAGSEKIEDSFRNVSTALERPNKVRNYEDLYAVIVVDAWLGNTDRNHGNVLTVSAGEGRIGLVMIDFEKSAALRPTPRIKSGMLEYRKLWPTDLLGQYARRTKPLHPPQTVINAISAVGSQRCQELLAPLLESLPNVAWADDSIGAINDRASKIGKIAEAVWQSV